VPAETRQGRCGYCTQAEARPPERQVLMTAARFAFLLAALALVPAARAAVDPHTPADTQVYIAIDVPEAFDSDFFKNNLLEPARELQKQAEGVEETLKETGLDPFTDVNRLILTSPAAKEKDRGLIIAYGKFNAEKIAKRIERLKKDADESVKLH